MNIPIMNFPSFLFVIAFATVPVGLGFRHYLKRSHLRERIYAILTSEFFQLRPGERFSLTEKGIAQVLDVPLNVVRDVMLRLENEGVIDRRPKAGITVVNPNEIQIDHETIEHYYNFRKLIECRNVRIVCASSKTEELEMTLSSCMLAMRGAQTGMASLKKDTKEYEILVRQLAGFDVRFHSSIAEVAGDDFMHHILEMLLAILLPVRRLSLNEPGRLEENLAEHDTILEKIVNRDPDGAALAMEKHIDAVSQVRREKRRAMRQGE